MKQSKRESLSLIQSKSTIERKKSKRKKVDDKKIIVREQTSEILSRAFNIAEFHYIHKKDQKKFENREVQNETIFISPDEIFKGKINQNGNLNWNFISKTFNKILTIEENGILTFSSFDNSKYKKINLNKIYEKDSKIISCELYENNTTPESKLLLLYNNFNFCIIDLFYLNINDENNEDDYISLENAKGIYFNFKPYLNIPNDDYFNPNFSNGMKILIFPSSLNTINNLIVLKCYCW